MSPLPWIVLLPLAGGLGLLLFQPQARALGQRVGWVAAGIALASFCLTLQLLSPEPGGGAYALEWAPGLGLSFHLFADGFGRLFALIISGIGTLVAFYAIWYLHPGERHAAFYSYLLLFMASMLGVVLSANLILLFVFWELTSITSFLLIGFWFDRDASRYGANKALVITGLGGLALLAGFVLLGLAHGSFDLADALACAPEVRPRLLASPHYAPAVVLILIGCLTKSAQWPFHIWLPNAMEAPTPVSAYLHSATMVKAGVFLVGRLWPLLSGTALWDWSLTACGLLTMFVGGAMALRQTDLKALLAYSTISQLGMMLALFGFGTAAGARAATVHIFNHAAFKASLFMVVGIIDHSCGSRDLRTIGNLRASLPFLFAVALPGVLSMAGMPPLGGFISKELFYESSLHSGLPGPWAAALPALALAASVLTFAYCGKLLVWTFLRQPQRPETGHGLHRPSLAFQLAPAALALLALLLGPAAGAFVPGLFEPAAFAVAPAAAGQQAHLHLALWHGWNAPLLMSLATVLVGSMVFLAIPILVRQGDRLAASPLGGLTPNAFYDRVLWGAVPRLCRELFLRFQSGFIRHYLLWLFAYVIASVGLLAWLKGWRPPLPRELPPIRPAELLACLVICLGALGTVLAPSRVTAVLSLGVTGYFVALLWVFMGAPDLALTQYLIETFSVILFLLLFYFLPPYFAERDRRWVRLRDAGIAALVAAAVGASIWFALNTHLHPTIADYYQTHSYSAGGGRNVVNVIIVDFRGFDTMGEISVLSIAAIGIYALLRLPLKRRQQPGGTPDGH